MNWLTADIPGIGGTYKQTPEDFQVEEIPLYPCSGKGEHLYLWVEKTAMTTRELLSHLSQILNIRDRDIGYAGLKDARALTRQMISIPFNKIDKLGKLNINNVKILKIERHTNKLRLGHLAGNRFTIILRHLHKQPLPQAEAILKQLQQRGVPNFFGEQRYGILGNSAELGQLFLQKKFVQFCHSFIGDPQLIRNPDWKRAAQLYRQGELQAAITCLPKKMVDERRLLQMLLDGKSMQTAVTSLPRNLLRLYLSASQSLLFDQLLFQRLPTLDQLFDGDIAVKHSNGSCFRVENASKEQPRVCSFEISPSAPLFGSKVMLAMGEVGQIEETLLQQRGLTLDSWKLPQGLTMTGERRPLRVPIVDAKVQELGEQHLTLKFCLPKGSYATSVLRELMKETTAVNPLVTATNNQN
ncbi:tRNA pseudouridine13 synthase [Desulfuromusa kysingii]|uniref:tRNA pseudouridine synthase D n=1 Tax=Desulfuromusa kysingii TaxID=37625 RepID=A0A1H3W269_9BACT|nr:tRNA pseudouridine(13) synthase TruD [Desulfuromusa kysingii]SDZ80428.1 tRNA pseudouridine13 synthase [Desulfuromusa kysingii]